MRRYSIIVIFWIFCFMYLFTGSSVIADELVWVPINPSFGGSPFNAAWLMQQAEAQNKLVEEEVGVDWQYDSDPLKDFAESLNRQILSRLSNRLIESAFGETELEPGHYEIGDYIIDITSTDTGIRVVITDPTTGAETTVEIPYY